MATLFVRHEVKVFQAWKKVYDGFAPTQKAMGVLAEAYIKQTATLTTLP